MVSKGSVEEFLIAPKHTVQSTAMKSSCALVAVVALLSPTTDAIPRPYSENAWKESKQTQTNRVSLLMICLIERD